MMTWADARDIAEIMMKADGGCAFCAGKLLQKFHERFPYFEEPIDEVWVGKGYTSMGWMDM